MNTSNVISGSRHTLGRAEIARNYRADSYPTKRYKVRQLTFELEPGTHVDPSQGPWFAFTLFGTYEIHKRPAPLESRHRGVFNIFTIYGPEGETLGEVAEFGLAKLGVQYFFQSKLERTLEEITSGGCSCPPELQNPQLKTVPCCSKCGAVIETP